MLVSAYGERKKMLVTVEFLNHPIAFQSLLIVVAKTV